MSDLITNADGTIDTTPVTGWAIGPLAGIAVVAAIAYQQQTGKGGLEDKKVQLTLLPGQALELAESLRKAAMRVLQPPASERAQ